jgi:aldehyde dehydrogenase (NAD+)
MDTVMERTTHITQDEMAARVEQIYQKQKAFFHSGGTLPYAFRKAQLKKLLVALKKYEEEVIIALQKDFRKSGFEAYGTEIGPLYTELKHTIRDLKNWMQPEKVATPPPFLPSSSWCYPDPLGNTLIISPWNYPFLLMFRPLISAIAGGNTMILKPSEISAHTAALITKIMGEYFDESYIAVINGDGEKAGNLLVGNYHFDHIFFTGSVPVGRKIMEMAARHLSPVTLELGGKSPCIVDKDANIEFAAKKVIWSKMVNAGQTCVAPDYLLVHEDIKEKFIVALKKYITTMYGEDPKQSPDFPRIISDRRFGAIIRYLEEGKIIFGGQTDASERYIAPTLLTNVSKTDLVMKEEVFGPVLPIISYKDDAEAMEWIAYNPYPLALYIYTNNKKVADHYIERVRFGGGCVNNGLIHLGNPELPFGGVGTSGIGQYHGEHGFNTFSRIKSIMKTPTWFDVPLLYPPYKDNLKWIRRIFR